MSCHSGKISRTCRKQSSGASTAQVEEIAVTSALNFHRSTRRVRFAVKRSLTDVPARDLHKVRPDRIRSSSGTFPRTAVPLSGR